MGGERILENNIFRIKQILEAYILTLLLFYLFFTIYFKRQITQVFYTNTAYYRWDKNCKAWRLSIVPSCDLIQMATLWLDTKQEYNDAIGNMNPRWAGDTVSVEDRDDALSLLEKMVWDFQRSGLGKLARPT